MTASHAGDQFQHRSAAPDTLTWALSARFECCKRPPHLARVFDLGSDAGVHLLHPLGHEVRFNERIQQPAIARAHRHVPGPSRSLRSLVLAPIDRVAECRVHRTLGTTHIVQCFLHGRVARPEPLLHMVNPQHRLDGKGWASCPGPRAVRLDNLLQRIPLNQPIHLLKELALACLLRRQIRAQAESSRRRNVLGNYGFGSCTERTGSEDRHYSSCHVMHSGLAPSFR